MRNAACLLLSAWLLTSASAEVARRLFTVADDIALSHFGDTYTDKIAPITFSPNERYFIVDTERGLLKADRSQSTLWVYRTSDVRRFLSHPKILRRPQPIWVMRRSTYKDGPVIAQLHWLADSSGFAFLVRVSSGNYQLFLGNLRTKTVMALTRRDQDITGFAIRDGRNFVYSVLSAEIRRQAERESDAPAIVATGRPLLDLLFPADKYPSLMSRWHDFSDLWAVVDGRRFVVKDEKFRRPMHLYSGGTGSLALSPDGRSVVTLLAVPSVPREWESEFPPPYPSLPYRIKAGPQKVAAFEGYLYVSEYVRIDLRRGEVRALTNAPTGFSAGWWHVPQAKWSPTGREILLSNTFLPPGQLGLATDKDRPCVALVDLHLNRVSCLDRLKRVTESGYEESYGRLDDFRFGPGINARTVTITYILLNGRRRTVTCERGGDGSWTSTSSVSESTGPSKSFDILVKQSFTEPPALVASDLENGVSRVILDPNPQLRQIELGEVSVFRWRDEAGREWAGGLYKPHDYTFAHAYPLVIQTHGFSESQFEPSGIYPTGFAARELAAAGILVLQMPDCPMRMTTGEAGCNVAGLEAAVEQLAADGAVDTSRIGIIGFSRTCYYVLQALTSSRLHFRAASITDGLNFGYLEYVTNLDSPEGRFAGQADAVIGAAPFGAGLQQWLARSPDFNMNKLTTPLQVVANGRCTILEMWEPYATLRLQHKPVDLIVLRNSTHVLTGPAERSVSQGGTVDWFRFWLQGYEDPNSAKAAQYTRWREMLNQMR